MLLDTHVAEISTTIPEPVETLFPDESEGGAAGRSRQDVRKREQRLQDDADFLAIVELAIPELLKYLEDEEEG
jgi:hypothetical protein